MGRDHIALTVLAKSPPSTRVATLIRPPADHTEQVDTRNGLLGDDGWDEDAGEETWDVGLGGGDEDWDESGDGLGRVSEDDQVSDRLRSGEGDQGDESGLADDEDQSWTGAEPAGSTVVDPQRATPGSRARCSRSQAPFAGAQNLTATAAALTIPRNGTVRRGQSPPTAPQPGLAALTN